MPAGFSFFVRLPKTITHEKPLKDCEALLDEFVSQASGLGHKLGCLPVQLPPSLALDEIIAHKFLRVLRACSRGAIALEARAESWFTADADARLASAGVGRVLADPVLFDAGRATGGDTKSVYVRLHGSPRMHYSACARECSMRLLSG